ncbi:hypothetical protein HAX54_033125 [Datura stramonium]|uniref:Uncharacterized protein n=1 Tax=Datura stramonium TaxID=4076 RepID=A0ABS8VBT4_DATST|nr:hypothetical protein [Datura stramonium]
MSHGDEGQRSMNSKTQIMPPKSTANQRNTASAEVSIGNNIANLPPRTKMQTRNWACSATYDARVRSQNATTNNRRSREASVSQPSHVGTSEAESRGAIQMLAYLLLRQAIKAQHALVSIYMTRQEL